MMQRTSMILDRPSWTLRNNSTRKMFVPSTRSIIFHSSVAVIPSLAESYCIPLSKQHSQRAWSPVSQGLLKAIPKGSNATTHAEYNDYYKEWKGFEQIDQTRLFMFRLQKFPLTLAYIITCWPNLIITSFIFLLFIYLSLYRCKGQNCWKVQSLPKYNLTWTSLLPERKLSAKCLYVYLRQLHPTTAPSQPPPPSNSNH